VLFIPLPALMSKDKVLSGIRPTGFLHLGNYFGAMRNWIKMQDEFDCYFFVADLHSLTTHPDTSHLRQSVNRVIAENIACGLDPNKCCFYVQSDVPEIAELYLILNMLAYKGELEKTTTFKEKIKLHKENINAGLLTYPVLQAADILIHKAGKVPVGKDQEQNMEMARNFAQRFNHRYGDYFTEPYGFNYDQELVKILSLDGNGKMSKSENENATIYLTDTAELVKKKISKAKTDSGPTEANMVKPDYIENLFTLLKIGSSQETVSFFEDAWNTQTIRYGDFKKQLGEDLANWLQPISEKANALMANQTELTNIRKSGAEKARISAKKTIEEVKNLMGLS
jgi:tryptophanyl-tRNA synthetase